MASLSQLARDARTIVPADALRSLSAPQPSTAAWATALLWAQLVAAWALALAGPLWLLPISYVVICASVVGLQLWVHDASHYNLSRNRTLNDLWADFLFASPIGMSIVLYRRNHMTHHAHLATPEDLDRFAFEPEIRGWSGLTGLLVRGLSGFEGLKVVIRKYLPGDRGAPAGVVRARFLSLLWNAGLLGACILAGRWYLYPLLWLHPILGIAVTVNVVRSIAEHQPADYHAVSSNGRIAEVVRTTLPSPLEKWLMYQANFNYHVEHHLFPGMPNHRLGEAHRLLRDGGFYERHPECLQRSGIERFAQLVLGRRDSNRAAASA